MKHERAFGRFPDTWKSERRVRTVRELSCFCAWVCAFCVECVSSRVSATDRAQGLKRPFPTHGQRLTRANRPAGRPRCFLVRCETAGFGQLIFLGSNFCNRTTVADRPIPAPRRYVPQKEGVRCSWWLPSIPAGGNLCCANEYSPSMPVRVELGCVR